MNTKSAPVLLTALTLAAPALLIGASTGSGEPGAKELFLSATASKERIEIVAVSSLDRSDPSRSNETESESAGDPGSDGEPVLTRRTTPTQESTERENSEIRRVNRGGSPLSAVGLRNRIELVTESSGEVQWVTPDHEFHSGDRIRLHFESTHDGKIRIFQRNAGEFEWLFPAAGEEGSDNILRAGEETPLPGPDAWFRFDHQAGTEVLMVLLSPLRSGGLGVDSGAGRDTSPPAETSPELLIASLRPGAKALVLETENRRGDELGAYAVNREGGEVMMTIHLKHR